MIRQIGLLLVIVTYVHTAKLPPCVCTRELKPVCGSDGLTYNNMCLLTCQQEYQPSLQPRSNGPCRSIRETNEKESCACTFEYNPVCASNGRSYPNKCAMACDGTPNLEVEYYGECRSKRQAAERMCLCPYIYSPVCGSNGETYGSECSLKCAEGVTLLHKGSCGAKREACLICPANYSPLCGKDGKTYANQCDLDCNGDGVEIAHEGECKVKRETVQVASLPPCQCTREARPVCGTDGKTYSNPCLLNCVREQNEDLHIDYPGRCSNEVETRNVNPNHPTCSCPKIMAPVCASNGKSYNSECEMECADPELAVEKYGRCDN